MSGTLYLVATPIGNLKDISSRAVETLRAVDLIACEDTRHTKKLLNAIDVRNKLISYHEHNEAERAVELGRRLLVGESVTLVSDAGTPAISDPGVRLVNTAIEVGANVVPIPGPAAFVSAAIVSGLPTEPLFFGGFLPSRKGERRKALASFSSIPATLVFYESPHRLAASLADCAAILGPRRAAVVRQLTKLHEEAVRGTLTEIRDKYSSAKPRGEFVLVIAGEAARLPLVQSAATIGRRVRELEDAGEERKAALKTAAKEFGVSRSEAYRILQTELDKK